MIELVFCIAILGILGALMLRIFATGAPRPKEAAYSLAMDLNHLLNYAYENPASLVESAEIGRDGSFGLYGSAVKLWRVRFGVPAYEWKNGKSALSEEYRKMQPLGYSIFRAAPFAAGLNMPGWYREYLGDFKDRSRSFYLPRWSMKKREHATAVAKMPARADLYKSFGVLARVYFIGSQGFYSTGGTNGINRGQPEFYVHPTDGYAISAALSELKLGRENKLLRWPEGFEQSTIVLQLRSKDLGEFAKTSQTQRINNTACVVISSGSNIARVPDFAPTPAAGGKKAQIVAVHFDSGGSDRVAEYKRQYCLCHELDWSASKKGLGKGDGAFKFCK